MAIEITYDGSTTDWGAKVVNLPVIVKSQHSPEGFIDIAPLTIDLADTERELWGSWYGTEGTQPLEHTISLSHDGTEAYAGEVQTVEWKQSLCKVNIVDKMKILKEKRFEMDFILAGTLKGTVHWGTIDNIRGTCIYFNDETGTEFYYSKKKIRLHPLLPFLRRTIYHKEKRYIDLDLIDENAIVAGDKLFFHSSEKWGNAENGNALQSRRTIYTVKQGSWHNNSGTLELDTRPPEANIGDYVYVQSPFIVWGSAPDVILQLLRGSNTIDPLTDASIGTESLATLGYRLGPMQCAYEVPEDGNVLQILNILAKEIGVIFYTSSEDKFITKHIGPYQYDEIDQVGYGMADIEEGFAFKYQNSDYFTRVVIDYNAPLGTNTTQNSIVIETQDHNPDYYVPLAFTREKRMSLEFFHTGDQAAAIGRRAALQYGTPRMNIDMGLVKVSNKNVYDRFNLTHDRGSFDDLTVEIFSHRKDVVGSRSVFNLREAGYLGSHTGFGWWGGGTGTFGFYDGFEEGLDNWTISTQCSSAAGATTSDYFESGEYSFHLKTTATNCYVKAVHCESLNYDSTIEWQWRMEATTGYHSFHALSPSGVVLFTFLADQGSLAYYFGGNQNLMSYNADQWYKIRLAHRFAATNFDIYIDGTLEATNADFRNSGTEIGSFLFYVGITNFSGDCYVDEFAFGTGTEPGTNSWGDIDATMSADSTFGWSISVHQGGELELDVYHPFSTGMYGTLGSDGTTIRFQDVRDWGSFGANEYFVMGSRKPGYIYNYRGYPWLGTFEVYEVLKVDGTKYTSGGWKIDVLRGQMNTAATNWGSKTKMYRIHPCPTFGQGTSFNMNVIKHGSQGFRWW